MEVTGDNGHAARVSCRKSRDRVVSHLPTDVHLPRTKVQEFTSRAGGPFPWGWFTSPPSPPFAFKELKIEFDRTELLSSLPHATPNSSPSATSDLSRLYFSCAAAHGRYHLFTARMCPPQECRQERQRNWSILALTRSPDISNEGVATVIMFYETRRRLRARNNIRLVRSWMILDKPGTGQEQGKRTCRVLNRPNMLLSVAAYSRA